ncbi:MAG: hypothetical protein IKL84_04715 [Clostridia bacterium]|nr:hypothetical protein [Clostridia bacterium]
MKQPSLPYRNKVMVAAHRGFSAKYPENTMVAFRAAAELPIDMLEIDLHMTADGEIVMMHDHKVNRTTNSRGLICSKTLAEIKQLDAGSWKGEEFAGEQVPTFREFLEYFRAYPDMLFNVELKDYPNDTGDFAFRSADKIIAMMDEFGITDRSVVNSWSGELNEYIDEKYEHRIRLHTYFPLELMGPAQKRFAWSYAYCTCLFASGESPVAEKKTFDFAKKCDVEPWVYYSKQTEESYDLAIERGAVLFTANDPEWAINHLRQKGLHD